MQKLITRAGHARLVGQIKELEAKVSEIQSKVGEVTTQSAETWHDNAPYSILVEELRVADKRLSDAVKELDGCQQAEYPTALPEPIVRYGTHVVFERDGEEMGFSIVGYGDTNIDEKRILYHTPLARTLIGKREGDEFVGEIRGKLHEFYIVSVEALGEKPLD